MKNLSTKRRLDDLDREFARLRGLLGQSSGARVGRPRDIFIAKTWSESVGTYPADPADTFEILFQDAEFTETVGDQTPTYTDLSADVMAIAHDISGRYLDRGTYVFVTKIGQWWILDTMTPA